jgi:hypothetical protein
VRAPEAIFRSREVLRHHKEDRVFVLACLNLEAVEQFHQVYLAASKSDGVRRAGVESHAESRPGCTPAERGRRQGCVRLLGCWRNGRTKGGRTGKAIGDCRKQDDEVASVNTASG